MKFRTIIQNIKTLIHEGEKRPDWGLNPGSSVYETDALPLGHQADDSFNEQHI